jgi:hypothetical protein
MKPVAELSLEELGGLVCETLMQAGINTVLSGGSCVSIWTENEFASNDLDFISYGLYGNKQIATVLSTLGFKAMKGSPRYFTHPDTDLAIEFPSGVPQVGDEPVPDERNSRLQTSTGVLKLLSPTDCIKDRLAAYHYWNDQQSFRQALAVADRQAVDWRALRNWFNTEDIADEYETFRITVESGKNN